MATTHIQCHQADLTTPSRVGGGDQEASNQGGLLLTLGLTLPATARDPSPQRTDKLLCFDHAGTTAVGLLLRGRTLMVANVGDSRAVLAERSGDKFIARDLSLDQTPYRCVTVWVCCVLAAFSCVCAGGRACVEES